MKYLLEFILATIIIFFVWNILKRIFFKSFYKFPTQNRNEQNKKNDKKVNQKINWDAETVDYEEVKEEKKEKK